MRKKLVVKDLNLVTDKELLDMRICDLPLSLEKSKFKDCISKVQKELNAKKLNIRPVLWLSDEWFCPDGVSGIAIPFYLMHERLIELERNYMGVVEGETKEWFMKLMRHECGHVVDNAFFLKDCEERIELFGDHRRRYPSQYKALKYSKNFVRHLEDGYAQAHPEEDWAESFAVWLDPKSGWRKNYATWPVLKKLKYLERTMRALKNQRPQVVCYQKVEEYTDMEYTLREYYNYKVKKFKRYSNKRRSIIHIKKLISVKEEDHCLYSEIRDNRNLLRRKVARAMNQYQYIIDTAIKDLEGLAKDKGLRVRRMSSKDKQLKKLERIVLGHSDQFLKTGKHKVIM